MSSLHRVHSRNLCAYEIKIIARTIHYAGAEIAVPVKERRPLMRLFAAEVPPLGAIFPGFIFGTVYNLPLQLR